LKINRAGYQCYYVPTATVVHHGGGSSQQAGRDFSSLHMQESAWRFFRKNRGRYYGLAYRASMLVSALVRLALLVAFFPAGVIRRPRANWSASFQKWKAILCWSVQRPGTRQDR
jgi:N-acetylglucosaminyl-diphospho-decaprenol L-rhamnosyltransferase